METTTAANRAMPGPDAPPRSPAMRKLLSVLDLFDIPEGDEPEIWPLTNPAVDRLANHEAVLVLELPKCDFCAAEANFDGRVRGISSWANMCSLHFEIHGVGLGLGVGQELIRGS